MASAASPELVTITINGIEIQVPKGELIVESVKRLGLEIPIFCYHPRMKPVGMCRMCLVEVGTKQPDGSVRKMPKPQAGCTLPASDGLVIFTDTEQVHKDRKGVLEFLLINHPLDCPICDRGGECPLQNNTIFYGPSTSRFTELKRHAVKSFPLSEYVTLDLERCIQCGRCVRFTEEISGDAQLAFRFRGGEMQPSTFQLTDFDSKFSGNVIEICPVGALTSSKYRFRSRPWDLETKEGQCLECSNHCSIWFDYRAGKFVRVNGRTNETLNEEWTCDKGKFGHAWYNSANRPRKVLIRDNRHFTEGTWSQAYEQILNQVQGKRVGILFGGRSSVEAMYLGHRFASEVLQTPNVDHRWTSTLLKPEETLEGSVGLSSLNLRVADLETKKSIVIFGTNLADDAPIVYLRARKAWFQNGAKVVQFLDRASEADAYAALSVRYRSGKEADVAAALMVAVANRAGFTLTDGHRDLIGNKLFGELCHAAGVSEDDMNRAAELLGPESALLASHSLLNKPDAARALRILGTLAQGSATPLGFLATDAHVPGAELLSLLPASGGMNTNEILTAARDFELDVLWLVDVDPFAAHPDSVLVEQALENVEFLIVQGHTPTAANAYASLVLPTAAPAEQTGTYVNVERRAQKFKQVLPAPDDCKATWRVFAELLMRTQPGQPYFGSDEVLAEVAAKLPMFAPLAGGQVEADGTFLSLEKFQPAALVTRS